MPKNKVVYAGLLHDSYTDENGKEIKYTGQIERKLLCRRF